MSNDLKSEISKFWVEREFTATEYRYTKWKPGFVFQQPQYGSRWFSGNFTIGLNVDNHPRFVNIILCLWFIELGISFTRDVQWEEVKK